MERAFLKGAPDHNFFIIIGGIVAVSLGVFVIDLLTPLGISAWVLYLIPVLLTFWIASLKAPVVVASICSVLIIAGFVWSPAGAPPDIVLLNRILGIMGLGVTALLVMRIKKVGGAMQTELTERIRAEESVRRSEARSRALLDAAMDAVIGADAEGRINYWNPSAETLFSWRSEEVLGKLLTETIIPPAYRDAHERGLRTLRETGEGPILNRRVEFTAVTREGREFPIELIVIPEKNDHAHRFHAFIEDISERKRKEHALRASEERFRAIAESSPIAMVISRESDGLILYANDQFGQLLVLPPHDTRARNLRDCFRDAAAYQRLLSSLLGPRRFLKNHEMEFKRETGEAFWAILSVHRITFDGVPALFAALHELTEQKRAEEQLRELTATLDRRVKERTQALQTANEKLQEHDRLKSAFVSIVSHELRTPMTSIRGYVENILSGFAGPLTEKQAYYLTRILHNVERLTRMLIDLLDLSRI